MSEQSQQAQPPQAQSAAANNTTLNTAQLSQRARVLDTAVEHLQQSSARTTDRIDQLVVTVEGITPLLERVLDEALGETASRDDVNTVQAQLASIATQLEGMSTAAPALRKGYDKATVELALDRQNRMQSIRRFGLEWYSHSEVRKYAPQELHLSQDKEFAELLSQMVLEGGLPTDTDTENPTSPATPATPATSLAANAAANSTLAGTVATPAPVLTPGTAVTATAPALRAITAITPTATVVTHTGGKPIKVEAAAPPIFSRIDVDTDIEDWLEQVRENCVFGQVDQSQWVVYASGFLGGEPKSQWLARKRESRLTGNTTKIMQWDSFAEWCRKTFAVSNRTQMAYRSLQNLKQTSTVAKYVSRFNVLSLQANMTEEQKIWAWYEGLKPDIRNKTEWDPVTKQRMATLQDAQFAAIAVDGFYMSSGTAGNTSGATAAATTSSGWPTSGQRKRDRQHASSSAAEPMEVDNRRQRTALQLSTGPVSKGVRQPDGKIKFPLAGTVMGNDVPSSVGPIIARLKEQRDFPSTVFMPAQRRPDGRAFRPGGGSCWVKGCQQTHNWASCPKLISYLQHNPHLDVQMGDSVRPTQNDRAPADRR